MEKQDLSKYLIKNSEYYNSSSAYAGMLKRHNIITVDQILDDSFLNLRCKYRTSRELSALIAMLRYRYLDEPLCTDILLDKEIDLEFMKLFLRQCGTSVPLLDEEGRKKNIQEQRKNFAEYLNNINKDPEYYSYFANSVPLADKMVCLIELLGCSVSMALDINRRFVSYVHIFGSRTQPPDFYQLPEKPKLIDLFKWILTKKDFEKVHPYVNTYIEVYEKKQNPQNNDSETMEYLRLQLSFLEEERIRLDAQIAFLTERIENKNKGGRKK